MILLLSLLCFQNNDPTISKSHQRGPTLNDEIVLPQESPYEIIQKMFVAIPQHWFKPEYKRSNQVAITADLQAELPPREKYGQTESMSFSTRVDGQYRPNGDYQYQLEGNLGRMTLLNTPVREMMASHNLKAYADQPKRTRSPNANLRSFDSWLMSYLNPLKAQILDSGIYRYAYGASGIYEGRPVHVIRVYKPMKQTKEIKGPMPLNRLWTFWHDGGYEIWVYQDNFLPAAIFYTNGPDLIFANLTFHYDRNHFPTEISFVNNSVGFEGEGSFRLAFNANGILEGFRFEFNGQRGQTIRLDASLDFEFLARPEPLRALPPFGYQKVNRDHLKLLMMTQITGGLLQLKKYGLNIKNFKF
ncbi:MAG: hypothetical protein H6510_06405 [Acidobacteria bacterium]|nr:hypothetical protein [Acidobacteriota bacterium]MCB9397427.1 hypothetical protein [Acidobacteriota bacterium]